MFDGVEFLRITDVSPTPLLASSPLSSLIMSTKTTDSLTFETLIGLFNFRGLYALSFSFIFGMTLWVSFIGGVIIHRVLPQRQFGPLQQRLLPVYFKLNTLISSGLLLAWIRNHSAVTAHLACPMVPDVSQAYALFIVVATQALNLFWFGPTTSKLLTERLELEKAEGKNAQDADASPDLKALKAKFARLHGYSSLANLLAFLALAFHGLWIGNYGITA